MPLLAEQLQAPQGKLAPLAFQVQLQGFQLKQGMGNPPRLEVQGQAFEGQAVGRPGQQTASQQNQQEAEGLADQAGKTPVER
ncbi:hypothetical protein [Azovibrio restrictus]|uniref:hypothetical protein n=1 Tax=Azovibrio restrictus TaxID=146938 RepID=UPI0026EE8B27|nr:hypothetical protein [Azovibrio restrictus]MDD3483008.1 hypothetical protein [Azovibrio restrictus]